MLPLEPSDELQVRRQPVQTRGGESASRIGRLWAGAARRAGSLLDRDGLVLGVLLVLAASIRLVGLPGRGDFDGDQGHDMLTLLRFVQDGQVPLLGPPTSIGDFHHGAAYYFLFAPAAWLSGANPDAMLLTIAGLGTAAVGVTWWLARSVGGRAAGAIAGLLLAVSPAAVEESTFLWNPNPIPFFAAVALAAAWRARQTRRDRWWVLSIASGGMVMQLHVLGIVFLPPILAFGVAEAIGALREGNRVRARRIAAGLAAGLAVVAALYVPLLINELQTGFEETGRFIAFFRGGSPGSAEGLDPVMRLLFTGLRIVGWPLVGLVTSAPLAAILAVSTAAGLGLWLMVAGHGEERTAARWLGFTVGWSALALTVLAPSLQTVVAGLPNDHYHAFLDPVVVILVALAVRALGSGSGLQVGADRAARVVATAAIVALVAFDLGRWPPLTQPNGGWPAARDAGARIVAGSPGATFDVRGLPIFKTAEGIGYPIVAAGGSAIIATNEDDSRLALAPGALFVISCDRLFETVIGDPCGGAAEERYLGRIPGIGTGPAAPVLIDRFDASPRTSVSVYQP